MARVEPRSADDEAGSYLEPGLRYYLFLGLAGLVVLWIALTDKFGILALVPVLVGALGMAGYLVPPTLGALSRTLRKPRPMMPILVMISIAMFEVVFGNVPYRSDIGAFRFDDLLLAPALLAYLAGQYRLFSLGTAAVPVDVRPRPDRLEGDEPDPRPGRSVQPVELLWLGGVIVACVLAGQWLWLMVSAEWSMAEDGEPARLQIVAAWWRLILLVWILGIGTFVLTGLFRVLRAYRQSADESRSVLQDVLWAETRGEQRRSARWATWARRRVQRQREKPS